MAKLVGILNITPDSFSDGGLFVEPHKAVERATQLFTDGAALIDIGAESTRPGALPLSDEEEWQRLAPVIKVLISRYPEKISLDSYHPSTVKKAFELGPVIVNDVTGLNNPEMLHFVCVRKPTVIISHLPNMDIQQAHADKPVATLRQVKDELLHKAALLEGKGFPREHIILDPGIGFGKTKELNEQLLTFAEHVPAYKVMVGYSRKGFLGKHRMQLGPNLKAGRIAVAHGAAYLRVHDVAGHASL